MPYIGSPASLVAPGRGAGTGSAVIFRGSNQGILNIYGQAQRLREARLAREAAVRVKAEQERFKQMQTGVKLDDDTAPYYQGAYSDLVAGAKQQVGARYNEKAPEYVPDAFTRQATVDKDLAPVRTYKRLADDDWTGYVKPTIATAKGDNELQGDEIEKALYNAHYTNGDAVNGTLIAPQDLPRGYHEKILNDPRYINQAAAADTFFKKIPASQEYAEAVKGKPGTYSTTDDLMTRLVAIEPDGKGGHQVKMDASGRPVLRNPLALLQATEGTKFGRLLDNDVKQYAALRESATTKMQNMEQLTAEERAAVSGPQKSKLDFLTDRALGHVQVRSKESTAYISYPRARTTTPTTVAGNASIAVSDGRVVDGHSDFQRNIPLVGQSFSPTKAGGKYPSVDVATRRAYVIGEGESKGGHEAVSGSLRLDKVLGRGLSLYDKHGDQLPLSLANEADAPQKMIQYMRVHPGQGTIAPVLFGENNDKAKTAGDGGRSRKPVGFVNSVGETIMNEQTGLPETDLVQALKLGSGAKAIYDNDYEGATRKVIVKTTQAADQQLRAQVPGFDINKPGPEWERVRKAAVQYGWGYENPYKAGSGRQQYATPPAPAAKRSTGVPALGAANPVKPAGTKSTGVKW